MFSKYVTNLISQIDAGQAVSDQISSLDELIGHLQTLRNEYQRSYDSYTEALTAALAKPDAWDFLDLPNNKHKTGRSPMAATTFKRDASRYMPIGKV